MKESINHLLILDKEKEYLIQANKWVVYKTKNKNPTIVCYKNGKRIHLSREILNYTGKSQIEKLNNDIFDYRKSNLRIRTYGDELSREMKKSREKSLFSRSVKRRISTYLRNRLKQALKNNSKQSSAIRDLGCTLKEFKDKLEKMFYTRSNGQQMSWDNYGEWHIDHKKPLSSFDLGRKDEQLKAIHYSNLQPLWREDNLKKGSSL